MDKEFLEIVGNGKTNGKCVKGDNCSFRHDTNKRGKVTPSNPSPNSFMHQSERKSSRTRSRIFSGGDSSKNYGADQQRLQRQKSHW